MNDTDLLAEALRRRDERVKAWVVSSADRRGKTTVAIVMFAVLVTALLLF
jgi:hypothetical protein